VPPMPRILVAASLAAALAVAAAGCGSSSSSGSTASTSSSASKPATTGKETSPAGDIPDNQAYVAYRGSGYSVKVPEGWARTGAGGAVTFTDKLNSVRIDESQPAGGAAARKPAGARLTTVSRPAGRAARITYVAKSAPDPVTGRQVTDAVERYVFTHGGRAVVLTLSGPTTADNVDPWKLITSSLRWTR
jgi:hypothetical protein